MWKDYSVSYIKNNRNSSVSVMAAVLISAFLLSLLCSLFYNFWIYEIGRLKSEEGAWQGRIEGAMDAGTVESIQHFANVETALVNEELSNGQNITVDICFLHKGTIFEDMPRIARLAGLPPESVSYHHTLLNMYLIRDPADTALRLLFPVILGITAVACISLIMVIHNSFAISMHARIHQFGIFSSIGATPGQIRTCLLQEAALLCLIPVIAGNLLGIFMSVWVIGQMNVLTAEVAGRHVSVFQYHPLVFAGTFAITILTIFISAWIPAWKMSRKTPLEAVKNIGELQLKRRNNSRILTFLFGVEGELAGNALKAQRKAMRTTTLSLVFSFLAFVLMQCMYTLSSISQRETYFARYQDAWDMIATVSDESVENFKETDAVQTLPGVTSGVVYQKASAKRIVSEDEISKELAAVGGFEHAPKEYVTKTEEGWLVNAPIVILDDGSFLAYCEQIGAEPRLDGAVIRNQTEDVTDPDFRNRKPFDYVTGQRKTSVLRQADIPYNQTSGGEETAAEIPILAYTQEVPVLREEYGSPDVYELVHFLPVSLWKEIKGQIGGTKKDTYIRILAGDTATLEDLNAMQEEIIKTLSAYDEVIVENRIQDKINNEKMIWGMLTIIGGFCLLIATIGIANLFSNTMGFVRQRNREFARYLSIGLTPEGLRKMFCIEALVIAGRPVLITLPAAVLLTGLMLKLSYLEPMIFIREAPVKPILAFLFAIAGCVTLAYYLGYRKVAKVSLTDALRDDTMI